MEMIKIRMQKQKLIKVILHKVEKRETILNMKCQIWAVLLDRN